MTQTTSTFTFTILKLTFLFFLLINHTISKIHSQIHNHQPKFIDAEEDSTFGPNPQNYPNIRIHVDYSLLEESSVKEYIQNELIPPVIDYFQAALKIKRPLKTPIKVPPTQEEICGNPTPQIFHATGALADLSLIITTSTVPNSTMVATAYTCRRVQSGRPAIGRLVFNTKGFLLPEGNFLIHERNMNLAIHEIVHLLGFYPPSYKFFVDEKGNPRTDHFRTFHINGEKRKILDLEPLTQRLRKHFGCPSIPGALLENDGGPGTRNVHFERRIFLYEIMTSGVLYGQRISEFTLALLEGTGWYVPDYSFAEPFPFGQGQGCDFYYGPAIQETTDEFCVEEGEIGCSPTGRGKGRCSKDSKSDGYAYFYPKLINDCESLTTKTFARLKEHEVFGKDSGSKCFGGTLSLKKKEARSTGFCFKYECRGQGLDTELEVSIGDTKVVCKEEGPLEVFGFKGYLDCPDPLAYCKTIGKQFCPRNCMGRGECVNEKCVCKPGFSGKDCSLGAARKGFLSNLKNSF